MIYWEGTLLRMMNKESFKNTQNNMNSDKSNRSEYQTVRLFAILGVLTLIFVLMIRLVQNGPNTTPQTILQRLPTTTAVGSEATNK
jgi:hypothetical protein